MAAAACIPAGRRSPGWCAQGEGGGRSSELRSRRRRRLVESGGGRWAAAAAAAGGGQQRREVGGSRWAAAVAASTRGTLTPCPLCPGLESLRQERDAVKKIVLSSPYTDPRAETRNWLVPLLHRLTTKLKACGNYDDLYCSSYL
jgi:hypothetical protein